MELHRALATLIEPPTPAHAAVAAAAGLPGLAAPDEHTDVIGFQAYPYAAVYLGPEGMLGGEALERVVGFWRALGVEPPAEPDHLGTLLSALAALADQEAGAPARPAAAIRAARHALLWEHVASWMPPYLALLRRIGGGFHVAWADLAEAALAAEAAQLGPPRALSAHLRAAAPAEEPADLDGLLAALLAPVRIGFTIARDDLLRAAGELELGCRVGERRFALRSLLAQDAPAVLRWLAAEARRQAAALDGSPLAPTASWWAARARRSSDRLGQWAEVAGRPLEERAGVERPA